MERNRERNRETSPHDLFAPARGAAFETWQLGLGRFPKWIFPPEGRPARLLCALYCNVDRREVGLVLAKDGGEPESALVERALRIAVHEWRTMPARIEVPEPGLVPILTGLLAETGVSVELGLDLSLLRAAERDLQAKFSDTEASPPGLLSGDGVTVAQITAFVHASGDFLASAPWRLFALQDLLRIEAPDDIDPELRWVSFGAARGKVLLSFFHNGEDWEALSPEDFDFDPDGEEETRWLLPLISRWELPGSDIDLWDRFGLPTFGEDELCPMPVCLSDRGVLRPDAHQLAFLEGLLRTLAAATEQEIDTGRWEKTVATHLGPRRFILSFPGLLELVEDLTHLEESEDDVADKIADLLDDAQELGGRRAVLLARSALTLNPGSAEACLELANATSDSAQAVELYRRALDLMDNRLDGTGSEDEDDLMDDLSPLLRVHAGLAKALTDLGRREEAVAHLFEIYRLDPGDLLDHQDRLAALLVELGRDGEAQALLTGNEGLSGPAYTLALLAFRREGDAPAARRALRIAWRNNSHIPSALLPNSLPEPPDRSSFSIEDLEADDYVRAALSAWRATPGALTWLFERSEDLSLADRTSHVRKGRKPKAQRKKKKRR
jgi:tetratricopeptide (TPR) repeat protein